MKEILITTQRKVLLEVLESLKYHPTAEEIYAEIRKRHPKVSLASVYRNLDLLSENGFIKKLDTGQTQKRYDPIVKQHYHIICVKCGKLEDVDLNPFSGIEDTIENQTGYNVISHNFQVNGVCPECIQKGFKKEVLNTK